MLLRVWGSNLKGESSLPNWTMRVMVAAKQEEIGLSAGDGWKLRELGRRSAGRI